MTARRPQALALASSARWALAGIMALLPFEPRRPTLPLFGLEFTLLELAAGLGLVTLLWNGRRRLASIARHPPLPLACLFAFAASHFLSAAMAPANRWMAAKFALRMAAAAAFALAVTITPRHAHHWGLTALAASTVLVATLAILEGIGARWLDPFLDLFRETLVVVGGTRRASAASEYPNLAAAFLMHGLLAGVGLAARASRPALPSLFATWVSLGLLHTYSRAALGAGVVGVAALALTECSPGGGRFRTSRPSRAYVPAAALAVLLVTSGLFAARSAFRLRLASDDTETWYRARYAPADVALSVAPEEKRDLAVTVTNTGREAWSGDGSFMLAYHLYDPQGRRNLLDDFGTQFRRPVAPGETVTLTVPFKAPEREGRYVLLWDMLHTHVGWFSRHGASPAPVTALVSRDPHAVAPSRALASSEALAAPAVTVEWKPDRRQLWSLALAMWRDHPLTGVGPDNFRWLYGPYARRSTWDFKVFANSAYLEAAATTGLVGLVALTATFASTLAGAVRGFSASPPGSNLARLFATLAALAAALTVHGLFDYVFAFTGHYLFLGFLVGAVSCRANGEADCGEDAR